MGQRGSPCDVPRGMRCPLHQRTGRHAPPFPGVVLVNADHPTPPLPLAGSVAIVTGAAQGLGLGIVERLAREGASVTIADIQDRKASDAADALRQQGFQVDSARLDVSNSDDVTHVINATAERAGRLDILVTSAGVGQTVTPITQLDDAEWQRVIDITLTGAFYCCRAAAGIMEQQERGSIVNLASINGQNPAALVAAYNVAKAGVISLTRTMALEMAAYCVRVNAVCPGPVYTDFNRTVMAQRCESLGITEDEMIEKVRTAIPLGRWGQPDDIAAVVAFLCGPDSRWMTGEIVRISGGMEGVSAAPPKRAVT
ncbi:MAG: sorbitol-6-phosphate 2-dehydrogenase [Planctomycetaceae bacterium]|nr:sorbitol-6-phosphate 2-dehydrogenase [Planctomycetaceae bacterium]